MKVYIASDFHLKLQEQKEDKIRREKVINFLMSLRGKAELLILNGDIFDLWFSWKNVIIKGYFPILKVLSELRENGCRIIFIAGNHDFYFGNFLRDYLKIEVYTDAYSTVIDGKKVYITHGDQHTSNDLRYKIFRILTHNKFIMKIFAMIHPDVSLKIGNLMSRSSRKQQASKKLLEKREAGLIKFAKKKMDEFDIVILGHSHIPKILKFENGIYANSGDWIENYSYLELINGKINLNVNKE